MTKQEQSEAQERLLEILKPGDTVFTVLRGVARSGMTRWIDLYVIRDNEPRWLSTLAARAAGFTFDRKREAIKVGGCGMDMGFHLVYELGARLWPHGTTEPHSTRNGESDRDGGYALKQRWL